MDRLVLGLQWLRANPPLAEAAMFLYMGAIKMGGPAGNEFVQQLVGRWGASWAARLLGCVELSDATRGSLSLSLLSLSLSPLSRSLPTVCAAVAAFVLQPGMPACHIYCILADSFISGSCGCVLWPAAAHVGEISLFCFSTPSQGCPSVLLSHVGAAHALLLCLAFAFRLGSTRARYGHGFCTNPQFCPS